MFPLNAPVAENEEANERKIQWDRSVNQRRRPPRAEYIWDVSTVRSVTGLHEVVLAALPAAGRLVLAVSGGIDSMVLLEVLRRTNRSRIACVATFDHGTGPSARRAVALVRRYCSGPSIPLVEGRGGGAVGEAGWREARYAFLRGCSAEHSATLVTAHTRDDRVETVLMRALRGAGARGLTGMTSGPRVARPMLDVNRTAVARYALATRIPWVDDPSNRSREHFRNRVRLDLLPALERAQPGFAERLLTVGNAAAALRQDLEGWIDRWLSVQMVWETELRVRRAELDVLDADSLPLVWSELASRVGLVLDRRGIARLTAFVGATRRTGRMPLSGGWWLEVERGGYALKREIRPPVEDEAYLPMAGSLEWNGYRFTVVSMECDGSPWSGWVAGAHAIVRQWRAGDRLVRGEAVGSRRVARYLSEAGLSRSERQQWPVVESENSVVWIPGVRRGDAATDRSGRPARHYRCELIDR